MVLRRVPGHRRIVERVPDPVHLQGKVLQLLVIGEAGGTISLCITLNDAPERTLLDDGPAILSFRSIGNNSRAGVISLLTC